MVRDLPPVAGSIIWVKQIDYQLTMYLKRVEDVLGNFSTFNLKKNYFSRFNIIMHISRQRMGESYRGSEIKG